MKHRAWSTLVMVAALALSAGFAASAQEPEIVLKAAHVIHADSHYDIGMVKFADLVRERTGGRIEVEIYRGGVLGQERDMIEAMQLNTLDIGLVATAPLGGFLPAMMLMDLPYIFRDRAHAYAVMDGEVGQELYSLLEKQRIVGLGWMENGWRCVFSNGKGVEKPADLEGVKIRVMENEVHTTTFQRLNAIPVSMAHGEVYTALQQGTVTASENAICAIHANRYVEVAKDLSLTNHFYSAVPMLMSKQRFDSLSADDQKILRDAAKEACDFQRKAIPELEGELLKEMQAAGLKVYEVDPKPFQEIFLSVYPEFEHIIPQELVQKALATQP